MKTSVWNRYTRNEKTKVSLPIIASTFILTHSFHAAVNIYIPSRCRTDMYDEQCVAKSTKIQ